MAPTRSPITCHVLDAALGRPAANVAVRLEQLQEGGSAFSVLANGVTDSDGRCSNLLDSSLRLSTGVYKMIFETGPYFAASNTQTFYPFVEITFNLSDPSQHYHIPLLLSPWSYTTYRGS
ncbi:hypothetical protein M407DRAFT_243663 [Tulasnella calospora MUT 4182]|uniref:5-hydroxyisourate hydrolase n=1 Tax=Tulasnella calospora MUT 4182 TaxID=1051891 RepID=A0A0C3KYU0_9AGAM|nr:hypothetical protein M407DRAFT_243663 [Tulasnella calospora MUT 4182]